MTRKSLWRKSAQRLLTGSRDGAVACLLSALLFTTTDAPGFDSFTVTIREEAGIARRQEPTSVSLPFAAGDLEKETEVALSDVSGQRIDVQFDVLARWGDGSIRWLLASFLSDVPAGQQRTFSVLQVDSSEAHRPALVRRQGANLFADTGPIRARFGPDQQDGFWITDQGGSPLLAERPQLIVYSPTGQEYRSSSPVTVDLEVNGPLYASVLLTGPFLASEEGYNKIFRWETRLHFWKGLAQVLAEHTVVAVGDTSDGVTIVDGIVVQMKARDGFTRSVFAGEQQHATDLRDGETARLQQTCAYWHECGSGPDPAREPVKYVVLEEDFGYQLKSGADRLLAAGEKSPGWLWAAGPRGSIGVAVRDFWEEGPKALRAGADGTLAVECYAHWKPRAGEIRPARPRTPDFSQHPRLDHWFDGQGVGIDTAVQRFLSDTGYAGPVRRGPFRFGRGRAKTTDVLYLFGQADQRENEINSLRSRRHRLIPVVDPRYLASTRALPFVWTAARDSGLPVFEQGLLKMFENWKAHATRYGFLHYGDDQCSFGYNRTVPSTSDNQEYDSTQCLTMQFARTGNVDYLRRANICARHFVDVDQRHPGGELCFHGYARTGDYHEEPGPVDMGGHPYIGGIVNHYMLTGDRRSWRSVQRVAGVLEHYGGDARQRVLTTDERSLARAGICLTAIYDLTRDPAHLAPVKRMVDAINTLGGDEVTSELRGKPPFHLWWINHNEMCYHVRELLVRYHAATGDPATLATLRKGLDIYIHELWDSQKIAWRGMFGAPFDFNMQYENAVSREPRRGSSTAAATAELGLPFAYLAEVSGQDSYLAPLLDSLGQLGSDFEMRFGNRDFSRRQLWSLPMVSILPSHWKQDRDDILQREVLTSSLNELDGLVALTPAGKIKGQAQGELLWADTPFGKALRTHGTSFASFPAPADILEQPGTVSFWVRRGEAHWDRKPWPWYGELRGLLHIGSDVRQTNALDLMILKDNLWTRMYDHRGWETAAIKSPSPAWQDDTWQHIAVVWNRFDLTVFIDGKQVGHEDRFALPAGGQTKIFLGWRPTNRYGQAHYQHLRVFRAALPAERIQQIYQSDRPRTIEAPDTVASQPETPDLANVGLRKQLLVDDYVVADTSHLVRRLGKIKRENGGQPVMEPNAREYPLYFGVYSTVLRDEDRFKMWYLATNRPEYDIGYAESQDGFHWKRPNVGRGGENNFVFQGHGFSCFIDPDEKNPEHRFKAAYGPAGTYLRSQKTVHLAHSADGIHWTAYNNGRAILDRKRRNHPHIEGRKFVAAGDTHNYITRDPDTRQYRLFTRDIYVGPVEGENRRVSRGSRSMTNPDIKADPKNWTMVRSWEFDREGPEEYTQRQIYALTDWIYEGVHIALMSVLKPGGLIDYYIGTSRDGASWDQRWVYAGKPLVPAGPAGSFDAAGAFPFSQIVTWADRHWLFYGAMDKGHKSKENRMTIGLASLRLDGFVSLSADQKVGQITTRPFKLGGSSLEINVDASGGEVLTEILDAGGRPIPGFTQADCVAASDVDQLRLQPTWREHKNVASLGGQTVRLRFYLQRAHLYAFQIRP